MSAARSGKAAKPRRSFSRYLEAEAFADRVRARWRSRSPNLPPPERWRDAAVYAFCFHVEPSRAPDFVDWVCAAMCLVRMPDDWGPNLYPVYLTHYLLPAVLGLPVGLPGRAVPGTAAATASAGGPS